jgi:hypothetical protein
MRRSAFLFGSNKKPGLGEVQENRVSRHLLLPGGLTFTGL